MTDNLFEARYDLTPKSKLKKFYESNKILIYSFIFIVVIFLGSLTYYLDSQDKKKISLSENYIEAKIYLENGDKEAALKVLKNLIFANDPAYSSLSFFMILNQNLISDYNEISTLFNHILKNNKFDEEIKNLLIYKKALLSTNYVDETEIINSIKPLLNKESLWKPHALLLLGDFFASKKQYIKAKEFYSQILSIKDLQKDLYDQAQSQLELISNE